MRSLGQTWEPACVSEPPVHGTVEPRFAAVRDVFVRCLAEAERGAAVCAYVDGEKVIDLWGGWADAERTEQWEQDTIACTFSTTKGMTATCAHLLVDRGQLDVDEPIATYWPEFAQSGKGGITLRMVLSHQAGLPWTTARLPRGKRLDWAVVSGALAEQAPVWDPGTRVEYHGGTFGYLVGNVIERIDGRSLPTFFTEEIAAPLDADFLMVSGPEHDHRCAEMVGPKTMVGPCGTRRWRSAGDGAATAFGTAEGLARVYASLTGPVDGVRLLRDETIDAAVEEQDLLRTTGTCGEYGLGYQLFWRLFPGMNASTFGHTGMGGSVGLADRQRGLAMGFVMNRMNGGSAAPLVNTTYQALIS